MSTKRQPSKQRRQTQNQKQRAALAARRAAATAGSPPAAKVASSTRPTQPASTNSGSVLSRFRTARPTGRAARSVEAPPSARAASRTPVGYRAALSAVLAAVAGVAVALFLFRVPVDRSGDALVTPEAVVAEWALTASAALREAPDATPAEVVAAVDDWSPWGAKPYAQASWPLSSLVLLPVLGTGLGFRAVSRRSPAKVVNRTMYVTLIGTLLIGQLMLVFLPAVISLAVAAFQVRKAEVITGSVATPDDVIDVDEVMERES